MVSRSRPLLSPSCARMVEILEMQSDAENPFYQEVGGSFVSGIKGDYFNVMGFPMHAFCRELSSLIEQGHVISNDASM